MKCSRMFTDTVLGCFKKIVYCLFVAMLCACNTDDDIENIPTLVVEGWIDNEGYPVVFVTTTIPITEEKHELSELGNYILRWARVAVSDGEREVVLTGKLDKRYFPPYIYTTGALRGEVGKNYRLTVSYDKYYAEAETTIPQPPTLDSLRVRPCDDSDTLYQIRAYFHDDLEQKSYYKFFTCMGNYSRMFLSSYMQTLSNEVFTPDEEIDIAVYKGRLVTNRETYIPYFKETDSVLVKFVRMDSISFRFWNQMEHNMALGGLPMTAAQKNPHSNIRGGQGYWCGYGSSVYPVVVADSLCPNH